MGRSNAGLAHVTTALLVGTFGLACGRAASGPAPNILLITLDTTRADHLGCYGYARETTPHIDALAAESIRYTRALSTSS